MTHEEALELIGTFLRAHYHETRWDIQGTTEVLQLWHAGDSYREELSRGFRVLLASQAEGVLTRLVQYQANRLIHNDKEARGYLEKIYEDLHLEWEEEGF